MDTTRALDDLRALRAGAYGCFGRRADALFELMDALLETGPTSAPVHLSLAPVHRRGWGSLYGALRHGRVSRSALRDLLVRFPLADGQPIYAVDVSVWARCDAETSPQRGYYYHPSRHSAGQPIVAGWAYQWINQLGFAHDSWTAPLDVQRVRPGEDANVLAATQIKELISRRPPDGATPLFVFDAGYDPVKLALALGEAKVAVLVRLRCDRCFYADPDPTTAAATGRPRRHGHKLACNDPTTWPTPSAEYRTETAHYGPVRVRAWADLHAKVQNHAAKGTRGPTPIVRGTLILVEVSRLPRQTRHPRALWLWWHGTGAPDLALLWRAYVRRFDQEHTFRFVKQTLDWTTPRVRYPAQADRWTWLVLLAYTQLRVARATVCDQRLPWERPLPRQRLTPYRVQRVFWTLLPLVGTPATPPKPCGRSPGRPKGARSGPARRYPAIKTAA